MKKLLLIICVCLIAAAFTSCKKIAELETVNSTTFGAGNYLVKKGTVAVTTPDTTYVFTAPADQIIFSGDGNYFNINCYRDNTTSLSITSTDKAVSNAITNIYEVHLFGMYKNTAQVYTNITTTNIGTITLGEVNLGETAAKGTFIATAGNGATATAKITGTFDLRLNK
ncbi:hypothetical protein KXQ82_07835 [Mucilaginibacter sp. HMF5004]|uniref:hypothetical protein n=1 Tax=Mucilaginibacter rivuli TaxID=2857527 RepID=UPI001C5E796B|nr:hypothetical protein [Mucilaginibacter rivuli]MBW4889621.1 hypothetical protein [Mucilaginibacter rivuli]